MRLMQQQTKIRTGDCESCSNQGCNNTLIESSRGKFIWMCDDCRDKELAVLMEQNKQAIVGTTAIINPVNSVSIEVSRQVDSSVEVRTDLFNAATVAIVELKKTIDSDETITNKPYALAEELKKRFDHHKEIIFNASEVIVQASNQQKAIQVYLNQLANQLRTEEREKLKIADINYPVKPVKPAVKRVTTTQTKKSTKLDKAELRKYAGELGVSEFTLQQIVVAKGITVAEAAAFMKNAVAQAKAGK